MKHIVNEIDNVRLLIVGDGPERKNLEFLVSKLGLNPYIIFIGSIPHYEIHQYFNIADLFVSLYELFNAGNPLLEALAYGKCIVTINNGGTGEFIAMGKMDAS